MSADRSTPFRTDLLSPAPLLLPAPRTKGPCTVKQPNILFILSDQFRAMCLEDDPVRTPHLDRFAETSTKLTNAVSAYPVCSPHRAMLLTGQHPSRNGVPINVNSANQAMMPGGVGLRDGLATWASVLNTRGYRTGLIGKLHTEPVRLPEDEIHGEGRRPEDGKVWDAWSPFNRRFGFEFWYSYGCCDHHLTPHYWTTDAPREQRTNVNQWSAEHETDVAIEFLENTPRDRPFALFLSWNPPHQPFDELPDDAPLEHYEAMSAQELLVRDNVDLTSDVGREAAAIAPMYYAAVERIDAELGRMTDALERLDLAEDTIVVFTSDHGMQLGSHDLLYKNVPWDESMRLPCLMRIPGRGKRETPAIFTSVDIAPTLIGLAGHSADIPEEMQGRDLSPLLRGNADMDENETSLYYRWPLPSDPSSARGLLTHQWKYIVERDGNGTCSSILLRRHDDPFELHPVNDPRVESELAGRLARELAAAEEPWEGLEWLHARADGSTA